jgi:hypothetical protein
MDNSVATQDGASAGRSARSDARKLRCLSFEPSTSEHQPSRVTHGCGGKLRGRAKNDMNWMRSAIIGLVKEVLESPQSPGIFKSFARWRMVQPVPLSTSPSRPRRNNIRPAQTRSSPSFAARFLGHCFGPISAPGGFFVQNWAVSLLDVVAFFPYEKERTHPQTVILCPLSYMWCCCRGGLCAAFRRCALGTTRRQEVCRC